MDMYEWVNEACLALLKQGRKTTISYRKQSIYHLMASITMDIVTSYLELNLLTFG